MSDRKPYIDFKEIKSRANFLDVLDRFHVQVRKVKENQYKAKCPLPSHSNEKETDSFCVGIGKETGHWSFCCKSDSCRKAGNGSQGNIIDFVRLMTGGGSTAYDAALQLSLWMAGNQNAPQGAGRNGSRQASSIASVDGDTDNRNSAPPAVNRPLAFTLKGIEHQHEEIQRRGISAETAKLFGVGFFPGKGSMQNRIIFPLLEDSQLIGYCGRATVEGQQPKWLMPRGLVKSFLYGLERCDALKPVVIVEGAWAVLYLAQHGCQAAALLGSEMTVAQEACLAPFSVVTVALDNDEAGTKKSAPIVERLKKNLKVFKARLVE